MKTIIFFICIPILLFSDVTIIMVGDAENNENYKNENNWTEILEKEFHNYNNIKFLNYSVDNCSIDKAEMLCKVALQVHNADIIVYTGGLSNIIKKTDLKEFKESLERTIENAYQKNVLFLFGKVDINVMANTHQYDTRYLQDLEQIYHDLIVKYNIMTFNFPVLDELDILDTDSEKQKIIASNIHPYLRQIILHLEHLKFILFIKSTTA